MLGICHGVAAGGSDEKPTPSHPGTVGACRRWWSGAVSLSARPRRQCALCRPGHRGRRSDSSSNRCRDDHRGVRGEPGHHPTGRQEHRLLSGCADEWGDARPQCRDHQLRRRSDYDHHPGDHDNAAGDTYDSAGHHHHATDRTAPWAAASPLRPSATVSRTRPRRRCLVVELSQKAGVVKPQPRGAVGRLRGGGDRLSRRCRPRLRCRGHRDGGRSRSGGAVDDLCIGALHPPIRQRTPGRRRSVADGRVMPGFAPNASVIIPAPITRAIAPTTAMGPASLHSPAHSSWV